MVVKKTNGGMIFVLEDVVEDVGIEMEEGIKKPLCAENNELKNYFSSGYDSYCTRHFFPSEKCKYLRIIDQVQTCVYHK